jgi:hypothetical protein
MGIYYGNEFYGLIIYESIDNLPNCIYKQYFTDETKKEEYISDMNSLFTSLDKNQKYLFNILTTSVSTLDNNLTSSICLQPFPVMKINELLELLNNNIQIDIISIDKIPSRFIF